MSAAQRPEGKTASSSQKRPGLRAAASALAAIGREFHARGWARGTSGNYSAVLQHSPLRLLISSSGLDKSQLHATDFLTAAEPDASGIRVLSGKGKPSAETLLHFAVARARAAGSVLHTHSVWNTLLSERFATKDGLAIQGYEMLKGLEGVATHEHREWIPIFRNTQNIAALAEEVESLLGREPAVHAFLLAGHGLYTWGEDVAQARRHVEILEFLFEVVGRREFSAPHSPA